MTDPVVGSTNLPQTAEELLGDLVNTLNDLYVLKQGETALYFHLAAVLQSHLGERT